MSLNKTDIYVFAHWMEFDEPVLMGVLSALQAKGKKAFSFEYDRAWLCKKWNAGHAQLSTVTELHCRVI